MKTIPCITLVLSLAAACGARAEMREFKDAKGRGIKAEPVVVRGQNIVLKKENGDEVPVAIKSLSADDQTWILQWIASDPKSLAYNFDCKHTESSGETLRSKMLLGKFEQTPKGYDVKITNRCQNAVEGVKVAYRVFMEDRVSNSGEEKLAVSYHSGLIPLEKMAYNQSQSISTKKLICEKLAPAGYFSTTRVFRDRLRGVWLKFYRHGQVIAEWKSQGVPKCDWPGEAKETTEIQDDLREAAEARKPEVPKPEAVNPAAPAEKRAAEKEPADGKDGEMPKELKIFDLEDLKE